LQTEDVNEIGGRRERRRLLGVEPAAVDGSVDAVSGLHLAADVT
jgi:hypothetical protein